uniref:Translocation protein SEC62 n=1 Tax=Ornithorhynchus anatinus TaxID=9258 RepID=F7B9C8_ORNAN
MGKRRLNRERLPGGVGEPSKEEKAIAKYLRFNCPTKSTNMMGHRVDYFIASKAVECLLDSKWAKAKKGEEALFTTRESVVDYCNRLLKKQFFHRALKVMKMKPDKDTKKEKEKSKAESGKEEERRSKKESVKDEKGKKEKEKEKKKDGDKEESKKEETPGTPKKKETKKKFKLEPHEDQHSSGNGNDFEMITKEELEQQTDGECEEEEEEEEEEENNEETTRPSQEKS